MTFIESDAPSGLNKHLLGLYHHELWYLASSIVTRCTTVFSETKPPETGHYIKVAPEIHAEIFGVLSHAAALKKLVFTSPTRLKDESLKVYQLRRFRASTLENLLKGIDLEELLQVRVRNTIEHFDEYLDRSIVQISEARAAKHPWAAYNLVLSDWGLFDPSPFPIRVYIASDRTFHNMKWSVDIGKICQEAEKIKERLQSAELVNNRKEPGGLLVVLGAG